MLSTDMSIISCKPIALRTVVCACWAPHQWKILPFVSMTHHGMYATLSIFRYILSAKVSSSKRLMEKEERVAFSHDAKVLQIVKILLVFHRRTYITAKHSSRKCV